MTTPSFSPMLASAPKNHTAGALLGDDNWALDVKADGIRCTVVVEDGAITTWGRDGQKLHRLPKAVAAQLAPLAANYYVLDGELVGGVLYLFDLPAAGELVGPYHPWYARRAALDTLLAAWKPSEVVRGVPYATTTTEKVRLIEKVVNGRGEGLVAKQIESTYRQGTRSPSWVKVKRQHEIDCVVTWLGTEKQNMGVGVYLDGSLVEVAEVGRLTADGARCEVGSVVTVRCLYSSEGNRLVQPTLPRLRFDKAPAECDFGQLDAARTNPMLLAELTAR